MSGAGGKRAQGRRRVLIEWLVVALLSTALVAFLAAGRITTRADNLIYDALSKLATRPTPEDILIVAIDNRSIDEMGRWPWPRARHIALLNELARARPKAVAYDVLFVDPDVAPQTDADLAKAMRAASPVYLPLTFDVPGDNGAPFKTVFPVPALRSATSGLGQINLAFDPDGTVRRAYLSEGDGRTQWPHLMELAYRADRGGPSQIYQAAAHGRPEGSKTGLLRDRQVLISFAGPAGHFRTVSASDVINGEVPATFLKDKLVLVGATADGLGDRYATPLSGGAEVMPGVELQANMLDALLRDRALKPLGPVGSTALSLAPLWLMLIGFVFLRPRANMVVGAGLLILTLAVSAGLFLGGRLWAPPVAALVGLVVVYPLWSWRRLEASSAYMIEELRAFAAEPDVLAELDTDRAGGGDVIGQQLELMRRAIGRTRDLRAFISDALHGLPDATLVTDLAGKVLIANRQADALFSGHQVGAPIDALTKGFSPFAPQDDGTGAGDQEVTTPSGAAFNMRRTALQNAAGETVGWIVRFTDISALKAAGRQREDILQLLTHDMRSPQVSILALLDGLDLEPVQPRLKSRLEGYARRTLSLADDFVNMARAESQEYAFETISLADILVDAADDLWPQSQAKGVTVIVHEGEEEDVYLVEADRNLLTRALINLIDNAVKYTDRGGMVDCRVTLSGSNLLCTIADTGQGMSPEQLASLFQRFRRLPSAQPRKDGVGLGLAFVHTVIQRHGGDIRCDSRPGAGTTFTLTLPRSAEA